MQTGDRDAKGNLFAVQVRLRFMTFIVFSRYTNGLSKSKQSVHVFSELHRKTSQVHVLLMSSSLGNIRG